MLCSDFTPRTLFNKDRHGVRFTAWQLIWILSKQLTLSETARNLPSKQFQPSDHRGFPWNCRKGMWMRYFSCYGICIFSLVWWTHVHDRVNVWISILRMIKSVKNRFIISTLAHHFFCLVTKICNNMHIWFLIPHINQINSQTQGQLISLWLNSCIG